MTCCYVINNIATKVIGICVGHLAVAFHCDLAPFEAYLIFIELSLMI